MTGSLHQIKVTYSALEDRLLVTVAGSGETHARIWLTRRFTQGLWDALVGVLEKFPSVRKDVNRQVRDALIAMRHHEVITTGGVSMERTPSAESPPEGAEGALAVEATFGPVQNDMARIAFKTREHTISLNLDEKSLHAFCHVMIDATVAAGWDLNLRVGDGNVVAPGRQVH